MHKRNRISREERSRILYKGDFKGTTRPGLMKKVNRVFERGFGSKAGKDGITNQSLGFLRRIKDKFLHVRRGSQGYRSTYVGASEKFSVAYYFGVGRSRAGAVFKIHNRGLFSRFRYRFNRKYRWQQEWLVPDKIPPENIEGAWIYERGLSPRWIPNPNFRP